MLLVNARHVKNVSGRKSDVLDCQWLQQLMTYGLLRGAFRPTEQACVQPATKNVHVRASVDEIAKSLPGHWRAEHLFTFKQALGAFDAVGTKLAECDTEIEAQLKVLQAHDGDPAKGRNGRRTRNARKFDLRTQLLRMCGMDLTRIDAVGVNTALAVISEVGADKSRFQTVKHFTAWLALCPGIKISGDKVLSAHTQRSCNHIRQALKLAAMRLSPNSSALGAFCQRMCARLDRARANTAVAHELA